MHSTPDTCYCLHSPLKDPLTPPSLCFSKAVYVQSWIEANSHLESFVFKGKAKLVALGEAISTMPTTCDLFFGVVTMNDMKCYLNLHTSKFLVQLFKSYGFEVGINIDVTHGPVYKVPCHFGSVADARRACGLFHNAYIGEFRMQLY